VPPADLEVVEVVGRRDLDGTRALLRVGVAVGDDRNPPADQRQDDVAADEVGIALVLGVDGDRGVAEHRLGPGGGDGDDACRVVLQRVVEMPEMAVDLDRLGLEVGDRRLQLDVPVDQPLVLVDQAFLVELDEGAGDGLGQALVHGEALAAPVRRGAQRCSWPMMCRGSPPSRPSTRSRKASRPMVRRSLPSDASLRSTIICVAMPAWSVPGCHRVGRPRIR
jgi:hypothetical protein